MLDYLYDNSKHPQKDGRKQPGSRKQSTVRIIERRVTAKGGHKQKSKFEGTDSVKNHGQFLIDNINVTTPVFHDGGGLGKSAVMNETFSIGSCNHSDGQWVNYDDKNRSAFEKRHDQNAENSFRRTKRQKIIRNGPGLRNTNIEENSRRQMNLYLEDWLRCFTNLKTKDIIITWMQHAALMRENRKIDG